MARKRRRRKTSLQRQWQRFQKRSLTFMVLAIVVGVVAFIFLPEQSFYQLLHKTLGPDSELTNLLIDLKRKQTQGNGNGSFDTNEDGGTTNLNTTEDFGLPAIGNYDQVVRHTAYTLVYDEAHEQARWVAHTLEKQNLTKRAERQDDFRPDPAVRTGSAVRSDYSRSGYDRGHLAPAADFSYSRKTMSESFFMSNMSPQRPALNRGKWRELEEQIRYWVRFDEQLYIITVPIFADKNKKIGTQNSISVPTAFFKVVLDMKEPTLKGIAFIMPNEGIDNDKLLQDFAVSIDQVEAQTGLDFFPQLEKDTALEKRLESQLNLNDWF